MRVGVLLPVVVHRTTARQPGDGDLEPVADGQGEDDGPDDARAKYATVKEKNGRLGRRDADDVDDDEGVSRLVQLGKLVKSHHPEMLAASPRHTDEAADGRANS